jgi:hypothetical protein
VSQLLEARLQSELRRRSARDISETEVERDWQLLQTSMATEKVEQGKRDSSLTASSRNTLRISAETGPDPGSPIQ